MRPTNLLMPTVVALSILGSNTHAFGVTSTLRYNVGLQLLKQGKSLINGSEQHIKKELENLKRTTLKRHEELKASAKDLTDIIHNHPAMTAVQLPQNVTTPQFFSSSKSSMPRTKVRNLISKNGGEQKRATVVCALLILAAALPQIL